MIRVKKDKENKRLKEEQQKKEEEESKGEGGEKQRIKLGNRLERSGFRRRFKN